MKIFYCLLLGSLCLGLTGCVEPKRFMALENRVAAMELENSRTISQSQEEMSQTATLAESVAAIEKRLNESPMVNPDTYAEIKYDIDTIKSDLQKLGGEIEALKYRIDSFADPGQNSVQTQLDRLDQAISRNYEKVVKLEKYMGFEPAVAGEPVQEKQTGPESPLKPEVNEEQELYNRAKKLFDDGDRENARIQFENFITKYPNSNNADNARFWIADSYYAEKWYEKAILEYQKVLENYPDSNKLAAARLKQGYAFAELGEKANARLILKELIKKHPDSNEARFAQEKLKYLQ